MSIQYSSFGKCSPLSKLPAKTPEMAVPNTGVWNRGWITPRNLKITPSLPMAYRMRGRGNMAPIRLWRRMKRP